MQYPYNLSNCNTNYSWGQKRSLEVKSWSYGHMLRTANKCCHTWYAWVLSFLLIKHMFQNAKFWAVIRGQWWSACGQSFDLRLAETYFLCDAAVFSFQWMQHAYIFSNNKKVIRGQINVMRGHKVNNRKKRLSSEVNEGHTLISMPRELIWHKTAGNCTKLSPPRGQHKTWSRNQTC